MFDYLIKLQNLIGFVKYIIANFFTNNNVISTKSTNNS